MRAIRHAMIRRALGTVSASRLDRVLAPATRGLGVVLTFHHIRPDQPSLGPENAGLSITPDFLERTLRLLRALGYAIVPIDGLVARLEDPDPRRPFAILTFDDGYRDFADAALPILKAHAAPFAVFACPGFAERTAPLWWLDLEEAVTRLDRLRLDLPSGTYSAASATLPEKREAFRALYWRLRGLDEAGLRAAIDALVQAARIDPRARTAALCLDWAGLRDLAREPLATVGAHSLTHARLAQIGFDAARAEMAASRARLGAELGVPIDHFAYPVGDRTSADRREFDLAAALCFSTAMTTRAGMLLPRHARQRMALPRVSVNGLYQQERYLRALLSGLPFLFGR